MNCIIFQFKNVLIVIQPDQDRVHFIAWSGDSATLTIEQTIEIMETRRREKIIR